MQSFFKISILVMFILASIFTTSFAQLPWTKDLNNPVMSGGSAGTWNRHVFMANVLYNPDSLRYEMWFNASAGPSTPNWRPYRIGFATSPDGRSWTFDPNPVMEPSPGQWDEYTVEAPMVIRENGEYKMWYTSFSPNNPRGIGYATSQDGIMWSKDTLNNPVMGAGVDGWEAGGAGYCFVRLVQGAGYEMWYTGFNINETKGQIGYASSGNGIIWTKANSVNPVLTTGSTGRWDETMVGGPRILIIDNVYHMWFWGWGVTWNPRQTGWAASVDGINWNKYNNSTTTSPLYLDSDPVLKTSAGQWDANYAESVTVMLEGDSLRMWYEGCREPTGTNLWMIGHATAPLIPTGLFEIEDVVSPDGYVLTQNHPNPFNPSTTIEFTLPKSEYTTLKVYNILGKEVVTVVSNKLNQGNHTFQFDGSDLASGIYYYQLVAGEFHQVKKMILLR
jgi:hypothetical protein